MGGARALFAGEARAWKTGFVLKAPALELEPCGRSPPKRALSEADQPEPPSPAYLANMGPHATSKMQICSLFCQCLQGPPNL